MHTTPSQLDLIKEYIYYTYIHHIDTYIPLSNNKPTLIKEHPYILIHDDMHQHTYTIQIYIPVNS